MKYKLDSEEKALLDAFEKDQLKSAKAVTKVMAATKEVARETVNKSRRVNLRLTERDYNLAHTRGIEEGLPYQTLLGSIIHKYLNGRLVEKRQH